MREGDKLLRKERRGNRRTKNRIYIHEGAKTSAENFCWRDSDNSGIWRGLKNSEAR